MGKVNKRKNSDKKKKPLTRKEVRKQKRQEKKRIKHVFFSQKKEKVLKNDKKSNKENVIKQPPPDSSDEEIPSDLEDVEIPKAGTSSTSQKPIIENPMDRFIKAAEKNKKLVKEITGGSRKRRIAQLKAENEQEDRVIRQLEKKLKIDKKRGDKSVPKCFNDGFDYILELCLPENIDKMYKAAKEAGNESPSADKKNDLGSDNELASMDSEIEDDPLEYTESSEEEEDDEDNDDPPTEYPDISEEEDDEEDVENEEASESSDNDENSHKYVRAPKYDTDESDQEVFDDDLASGDSELEDADNDTDKNDQSGEKDDWEDIYGRKRDKDGNVVPGAATNGKYVPPQLRKSTDSTESPANSEKIQRLKKQLKGWLNRLAEANLPKIAKDTEDLYMQNSRHDMNHTLCSLIVDSIVTPTAAAERMVLEHSLLIAILHANVGNEVGAHFLEALIEKFDTKLNQIESYDVENKELDNVVLFLCHLYTFRISQHSLIFEMLQRLIGELSEKCVECILVILRAVGFALRKDDPGALKEFIGEVRQKAEKLPEALKDNARMKFMLDILVAIKNNNMLKIPNYDPALAEHLRKVLKGTLKNGKYVTTLNIAMDDLLSADQRGKWWIVGSAWTGRQIDVAPTSRDNKKFSQDVLELAHKHRMNTEERRNVFCTLVVATDQMDAARRLMELSIKDNRVIASILIYCCICEETYNAFYSVVAVTLCHADRKYRLAIQFAAWDKMKELENLTDIQIENFSKFLSHLIEEGAQALSIIKVIDYGQIDKASVKLVRRILLTILLKDDYTCRKVFTKIAPSAKLNSFKTSIKLFLHQFLLEKTSKLDLPAEQLEMVKNRIEIADEALSADSKILM